MHLPPGAAVPDAAAPAGAVPAPPVTKKGTPAEAVLTFHQEGKKSLWQPFEREHAATAFSAAAKEMPKELEVPIQPHRVGMATKKGDFTVIMLKIEHARAFAKENPTVTFVDAEGVQAQFEVSAKLLVSKLGA